MGKCDRCLEAQATERVTCWMGCPHYQCERCANQTRSDAQASSADDREPWKPSP